MPLSSICASPEHRTVTADLAAQMLWKSERHQLRKVCQASIFVIERASQELSWKKRQQKKKDPRWTSSQNTADVYRFKTVTVTRESISEAKKDFSSSRSHLSPHTSPCWVQSGHRCGHSTLDRRPCQGAGGRTSTDTKHEVELLLKAPEALDFIRTHLQGSGHPLSPPHDAADHSPSDKRGEAAEKMLHHSWLGVSSRHAMWPADTLPYCWGLGAKAGRSMVGEPDQSLVP